MFNQRIQLLSGMMMKGDLSAPVLKAGVLVVRETAGVTVVLVTETGALAEAVCNAVMAAEAPVSCPAIFGDTAGNSTVLPATAEVEAVADNAADGVLVVLSATGRELMIGVPPRTSGGAATGGRGEAIGYCMS